MGIKGTPTQQRASWFHQRDKEGSLDLAPPFQRKPVWSIKNKSYLIDTIIRGLPIPEIYMQIKTDKEGKTKYTVVDGQQRIRSIMEFLEGEFSILEEDNQDYADKEFKDLPDGVKKDIWDYNFVVRELDDCSDIEVRDIFKRLNKNVVPLTRQELRNAMYTGHFIGLMNQLSDDEFWSVNKIVSPNDIRRMIDAEFISELFIAMLHGVQAKDADVMDGFYKQYDENFPDKDEALKKFRKVLDTIEEIIPDLRATLWHYKVDFYSLFLAIHELLETYTFPAERYGEILNNLDNFERELSVEESKLTGWAKEYHEAASKHTTNLENRKKRTEIVRRLIIPLLIAKDPKRNFNEEERRIAWSLSKDKKCAICGKKVDWGEYHLDHVTPHAKGGKTELKNAQITHNTCNESKSKK